LSYSGFGLAALPVIQSPHRVVREHAPVRRRLRSADTGDRAQTPTG
jgi:hypothetical protein